MNATARPSRLSLKGLTVAVAGFVLCFAAFYPGFMSLDSLYQYQVAKTLVFSDWHPPLMSLLWAFFGYVSDGPQGLLVTHLLLLWGALYIWYRHYETRPWAWLLLAIGFMPWVINFSGVIWKDVGMAFSLLMLVAVGVSGRSPAKVLFALLLFFYAINVRHNAIFAVVPLLFLIVARWFPALSRLKVAIAGFVLLLAGMLASNLLNYQLLDAVKTHSSNYMMVDDLVYLSMRENKSLLPDVPFTDIQDCAGFEVGGTKLVSRVSCLLKKPAYAHNEFIPHNSLMPYWLPQVMKRPFEYLGFRLAAFAYLLRSPDKPPFYIWHPGIDSNEFGLVQKDNFFTEAVREVVQGTATLAPFMFKPYWWLWVASLMLLYTLACAVNSSTRIVQALLVSSIFYIFGYVPATPLADFRYVYWSVIATCVAGALLVIDRPRLRGGAVGVRVGLVVLALAATALLFNANRIFQVNVDEYLLASLEGKKHELTASPLAIDLRSKKEGFVVSGDYPQLVYRLADIDILDTVRFVGFDFYCKDASSGEVSVNLSWWGGPPIASSKPQSITAAVRPGLNIVPVKDMAGSSSSDALKNLKIVLINAGDCRPIVLNDLWLN